MYGVLEPCPKSVLSTGIRMVNDNKRGKEDNVNRTRKTGIAVGLAHDQRVAFATAPGKRHEC